MKRRKALLSEEELLVRKERELAPRVLHFSAVHLNRQQWLFPKSSESHLVMSIVQCDSSPTYSAFHQFITAASLFSDCSYTSRHSTCYLTRKRVEVTECSM